MRKWVPTGDIWPSLTSPVRHDGGSYVTPKFSCTQYGHDAGSDTKWVVVGSARLIWTKHSVQMAWSQHRERFILDG